MRLYRRLMAKDERHPVDQIVEWKQDVDSILREIYIGKKCAGQFKSFLFATYHIKKNLFNVWGFAPSKKYSYEIVQELINILKKDYPNCCGMLIEVDNKTEKGLDNIEEYKKYAKLEGTELKEITAISYRIPDLSGSYDISKAKRMALLYAPMPWNSDLDVNNQAVIEQLVDYLYSDIYPGCDPNDDNDRWLEHLKEVKQIIMDSYKPISV